MAEINPEPPLGYITIWAGRTQRLEVFVTPNDSEISKKDINVVFKIYNNENKLITTQNRLTDETGYAYLEYAFPKRGNYYVKAFVGDDYCEDNWDVMSLLGSINVTSNNSSQDNYEIITNILPDYPSEPASNIPCVLGLTSKLEDYSGEIIMDGELNYNFNWGEHWELNFTQNAFQAQMSGYDKDGNSISIWSGGNIPVSESYRVSIKSDKYSGIRIYEDGILKNTLPYSTLKSLYAVGQMNISNISLTEFKEYSGKTDGSGNFKVENILKEGEVTATAIAAYGEERLTSETVIIKKLFDSIVLTSSSDVIQSGEDITFTAQLMLNDAPAKIPRQTVEFYNDDELIGTATTNSDGVASVSYYEKDETSLNILAECGIIQSEIYSLFNNLYQNNILTCPRLKAGGSTGTTTVSELSDGSIYIKRNGWSVYTFFNLITLNKTFKMKFEFYNYNNTRNCIGIKDTLQLLFAPGDYFGFTDYYNIPNWPEKSSSQIPLNQWYTIELEYTGDKLIGILYDENNIYYTASKELTLPESFDVGLTFGYFGTYDNKGYENKIRNIQILG